MIIDKFISGMPALIPNFICKMSYIVDTMRLRQNGCHFADDVFELIFVNEIIIIYFWLKFD